VYLTVTMIANKGKLTTHVESAKKSNQD